MNLLKAAARDHIPVHPGHGRSRVVPSQDTKGKGKTVPEPDNRPSIGEVIEEIERQEWYMEQIAHRRISDARDGQRGILSRC